MSIRTQLNCFFLYLSGLFCASTCISEVKWKSESGLCFSFVWLVLVKRKNETRLFALILLSSPGWYITNHITTCVGRLWNETLWQDWLFLLQYQNTTSLKCLQNSHFIIFFSQNVNHRRHGALFLFSPRQYRNRREVTCVILMKDALSHDMCWPKQSGVACFFKVQHARMKCSFENSLLTTVNFFVTHLKILLTSNWLFQLYTVSWLTIKMQ